MVRYKLTNEAIKDLEEIWSYTKQKWSIEQADRYYNLPKYMTKIGNNS